MIQKTKTVYNFAPLPLRIISGIGFMMHGLPKLLDISNTQNSFTNMGLPPELAIVIGLLEFIGGLAILLGVLTRIAAGLLAINMIGAILLVKLSKGFIDGYELDLLYLAIMISLMLTGPGNVSIEKNVLKRELFPKAPKYSINEKENG
ncbi:MAG TPA: DoxX family protein [Nitrososphaeraceae archaeon]|nr:DoxX family protein [Nitrososphaeraceae archaeon]HSL12758.1 DoxX family protein [Nitrososphaeraceae archaeon]